MLTGFPADSPPVSTRRQRVVTADQWGQPERVMIETNSGLVALGLMESSMVSASDTSKGSPGFCGSTNIFATTPSFTSIE